MFSCAHAQLDYETGEYINYVIDCNYKSTYKIFKMSESDPKGSIICKFEDEPCFIHSFGITKNYIIFMLFPTVLKLVVKNKLINDRKINF